MLQRETGEGDVNDMYYKDAPVGSIAAGDDFGRLSRLAELGIATDVSTLERLTLSAVRTPRSPARAQRRPTRAPPRRCAATWW